MQFFLDSANLQDIEEGLRLGFLSGVTTNPSLMSKEPKGSYEKHLKEVANLVHCCSTYRHLSVEVFETDPEKMYEQGKQLYCEFCSSKVAIKIPIGWQELEVISRLAMKHAPLDEQIPVNCTCIFTVGQALLAEQAGASYVSVFGGRLKDICGAPASVISTIREALERTNSKCQIIAGSVRSPSDVEEYAKAGAHIVTTSLAVYKQMAQHPQTTASVNGFITDFKAWMEK